MTNHYLENIKQSFGALSPRLREWESAVIEKVGTLSPRLRELESALFDTVGAVPPRLREFELAISHQLSRFQCNVASSPSKTSSLPKVGKEDDDERILLSHPLGLDVIDDDDDILYA